MDYLTKAALAELYGPRERVSHVLAVPAAEVMFVWPVLLSNWRHVYRGLRAGVPGDMSWYLDQLGDA